MNVISIKRAFK